MSTIILCRTCELELSLAEEQDIVSCPACGTRNARPQAKGEALDKLCRATRLRLRGEFAEAEGCYQHVLVECDDEHEALWGKLLCQYGVEFITDPKSGQRRATVHIPRSRPLQLHADFDRACELAPADIRAQYEAEAAYVDEALAEINRLRENGEACDVFICHKTTHLDGPGYTEDYNRGIQLTRSLEKAGYSVFFAPFADLAPGASYEAGIYHALSTAKVMLLIASEPAFMTSPWVKSEWMRYLEMIDEGAEKRLIPLMYGGLSEVRLPKEIRLRGLQSIRMDDDLDAKDKLLAALAKYVGKAAKPAGKQTTPAPAYAPESCFRTEAVEGGVAVNGYTGPGGAVWIPETLGGQRVVEIGREAFRTNTMLEEVVLPGGVTRIGCGAFRECTNLRRVSLPEELNVLSGNAFQGCVSLQEISLPGSLTEIAGYTFNGCQSLQEIVIPDQVVSIGESAFDFCRNLQSVTLPAGLRSIGSMAFYRCAELSRINLPEGVKLGKDVFGQCRKLPASITRRSSTGFVGFFDKLLPF